MRLVNRPGRSAVATFDAATRNLAASAAKAGGQGSADDIENRIHEAAVPGSWKPVRQ